MRSKTAVVAAALLATALGARLLAPPRADDGRQAVEAVRQFDDPAAALRLRESADARWRDEIGWLATFAALAAAAAGAEVYTRSSTRHTVPEGTS